MWWRSAKLHCECILHASIAFLLCMIPSSLHGWINALPRGLLVLPPPLLLPFNGIPLSAKTLFWKQSTIQWFQKWDRFNPLSPAGRPSPLSDQAVVQMAGSWLLCWNCRAKENLKKSPSPVVTSPCGMNLLPIGNNMGDLNNSRSLAPEIYLF